MTYKISAKAREDIEEIWLYTFKNWSIEQADRYVSLLFEEINYLAQHPDSGREFDNIRKNYRGSKLKSHLIFYRWIKSQGYIEIIRVLHERMDIENRLDS